MIVLAFLAFWAVIWLIASIACKYLALSARALPTIVSAIEVSNGATPRVPVTNAIHRASAEAEAAARAAARA